MHGKEQHRSQNLHTATKKWDGEDNFTLDYTRLIRKITCLKKIYRKQNLRLHLSPSGLSPPERSTENTGCCTTAASVHKNLYTTDEQNLVGNMLLWISLNTVLNNTYISLSEIRSCSILHEPSVSLHCWLLIEPLIFWRLSRSLNPKTGNFNRAEKQDDFNLSPVEVSMQNKACVTTCLVFFCLDHAD